MIVAKRNAVKPKKVDRMDLDLKEYDLRDDKYGPTAKNSLGKILFTKEELEDGTNTE